MNSLFFYLFIAIGILVIAIALYFHNYNMVMGSGLEDIWRKTMSVENQYYVDKIDEEVKILRDSGKYPDTTLSNEQIADKIIQYFMENDLYSNGLHIWDSEYHGKWVAEQYEEIVTPNKSALATLFG